MRFTSGRSRRGTADVLRLSRKPAPVSAHNSSGCNGSVSLRPPVVSVQPSRGLLGGESAHRPQNDGGPFRPVEMSQTKEIASGGLIEGQKIGCFRASIVAWSCVLMFVEGYDMQVTNFAAPSII